MSLRARVLFFGGLLLLISACADKEAVSLGPLQWQDVQFVVETRPTPLREGMNEFIVIATRERGRPGVGLIVSIRVDENMDWRQTIQDGYTGVYRRALRVNDPQRDVLSVKIFNTKAEEGEVVEEILYFPLNTR